MEGGVWVKMDTHKDECWDGRVMDAPTGKGWMEWELRWRAGVVHKDGQQTG